MGTRTRQGVLDEGHLMRRSCRALTSAPTPPSHRCRRAAWARSLALTRSLAMSAPSSTRYPKYRLLNLTFTQLTPNLHPNFHSYHLTFTQLSPSLHPTFIQFTKLSSKSLNFHPTFTQLSFNSHPTFTQGTQLHPNYSTFTQLPLNFHPFHSTSTQRSLKCALSLVHTARAQACPRVRKRENGLTGTHNTSPLRDTCLVLGD
jgi:hypothetical protein